MPTSIIKIYSQKYRKWAKGSKVVLSWDGIFNAGMSRPVYTDHDGVAAIDHSSTGQATIYVDGKRVGKLNTPGSKTITT